MNSKTQVPEKNISSVKKFSDLIKSKRTILIVSIKNLPASQFQEISKKLRGKALVKVPKKNLIIRAINDSKNEKVKKIKKYIGESIAILFSDLDSFELAYELVKNKSPAKAKPGQEAPEDIEVLAGPTDLMPGPAISELGALGIQIKIEKGKIAIKEPKVIVKKGKKISANAADVMNKLDMKPFSVGFIPLVAFDTKEEKLYLNININEEEAVNEMKSLFRKALAFAVSMGYSSKDTIKFLLAKAGIHEKVLENLSGKQEAKPLATSPTSSQSKGNPEETKNKEETKDSEEVEKKEDISEKSEDNKENNTQEENSEEVKN